MSTPTVIPPASHPIVRFLNSLPALLVGLTFFFGGIVLVFVPLFVLKIHDDRIIAGGGVAAAVGGLMITPVALGGALKSLGLTVSQFWPGGKRAGDPPAGGNRG